MKHPSNKIKSYYLDNKLLTLSIIVTGLLFDGLMLFVPILQGRLIDTFNESDDFKIILKSASIFLGFIVFVQINRFFKRYTVRLFSNKVVRRMRLVSMSHLLKMNVKDVQNDTKGNLVNKNLQDIADCAEGMRKVTTEVFDSFVLLLGYFISLLVLDYRLTLIIGIFALFAINFPNLIKKKIIASTRQYKKEYSQNKELQLNLIRNEMNFRNIGVSQNYYNLYETKQGKLYHTSIKSMVLHSGLEPVYNLIALLGLSFVIYFNSVKVMDNIWKIGLFTTYLTTYILMSIKVGKVGKVFNAYEKAKVSFENCKEFLKDEEFKINIFPKNIDLRIKANYKINDNFSLNNLDIEINSGELIALTGRIRSGKTSLINMLSGLYDYEGNILFNNHELREIKEEGFTNLTHIVYTDNEIFNASIKDNISFGNDQDLDNVLKNVMLYDEVKNILDKKITIDSSTLSGGQKARLCLARALYGNPKLILLDNIFSALDTSMAKEILYNIRKNYHNSIIIISTNNIDLLTDFDKVIYLDDKPYFNTLENLKEEPAFKAFFLGGIR